MNLPPIDLDAVREEAAKIPARELRRRATEEWWGAMTAQGVERQRRLYLIGMICLRIADESVWETIPPFSEYRSTR